MELNFCTINGLPSVQTPFGDISLVELKDKYNSAAEMPPHVINMVNRTDASIGKLGVFHTLNYKEGATDGRHLNSLLEEILGRLAAKTFEGDVWAYDASPFNHQPLINHYRGPSGSTSHNSTSYELSNFGTDMCLNIVLQNGVFFGTETKGPRSNTYGGYGYGPTKFMGTVKLLGMKTQFLIRPPVLSGLLFDQDKIVQEIKTYMETKLPGSNLLTEFEFYADLESALGEKPLFVKFPAKLD